MECAVGRWSESRRLASEDKLIKRTILHLGTRYKDSQRVCSYNPIPEEYSSTWEVRAHGRIGHDWLALTGDGTVLVVNFRVKLLVEGQAGAIGAVLSAVHQNKAYYTRSRLTVPEKNGCFSRDFGDYQGDYSRPLSRS